jgi:hypothetical protein
MRPRRLAILAALFGLAGCSLLALAAYSYPPINERVAWRVHNLRVQVWRAIFPPEQVVFVPQQQGDGPASLAAAPVSTAWPSPSASPSATLTPVGPTGTPFPTATSTPTPLPTLTPTPIPDSLVLTGIRHEYQTFNNCGPATLSMALSYWGWQGSQTVTREYLRPSFALDDKNVNPFEMAAFVETHTSWRALWRAGGDLQLLKRLVAGGFPVIIEQGLLRPNEAWTGHYRLINGYDDSTNRVIVHDSLQGPDRGYPVPYDEIERLWPHFNYVYVVIYPEEREAEVLTILGPRADPAASFAHAAETARRMIDTSSGLERYFAWFNLGNSLAQLEQYAEAAAAFDAGFEVYAALPEEVRPWRMMWYTDGPYAAYYHTGRYDDVISLARATLSTVDKPVLEETFYWRGMARDALGDREGALADLRRAYDLNPNATAAGQTLLGMGADLP